MSKIASCTQTMNEKGNEPPTTVPVAPKTDEPVKGAKTEAAVKPKPKSKARRTKAEELADLRAYEAASRVPLPYDDDEEVPVPAPTKKRGRPTKSSADAKTTDSKQSTETKTSTPAPAEPKRGRPKRANAVAGVAAATKRVKSERVAKVPLTERAKWEAFITGGKPKLSE
jgi:hypothetical protein